MGKGGVQTLPFFFCAFAHVGGPCTLRQMTEWRTCTIDERYCVSDDGDVRGPRGRLIPRKNVAGYMTVSIGRNRHPVHRLVAVSFHGNPTEVDMVVDHLNGVKTDNRAANLEWVTRQENTRRADLSQRVRGSNAALTNAQVGELRRSLRNGGDAQEFVRRWRVSRDVIRRALTGKTHRECSESPVNAMVSFVGEAPSVPGPPTQPNEEWRSTRYDGYLVSNEGRVFSTKFGRLLSPVVTPQGYLRLQLREGGKGVNIFLHRLVADAFLPPPDEGQVLAHLNECSTDARVANLRWVSRRTNALSSHAFRKSNRVLGEVLDYLHTEKVKARLSGDTIDAGELSIIVHDVVTGSDRNGVPRGRLVRRVDQIVNQGKVAVALFSTEWDHKGSIARSMLLHRLERTPQRIAARKTVVREVSVADATSFLRQNHMQGATGSTVRLGLYDGDTLVALATYARCRYGADRGHELIRYVTKTFTTVMGGFGKLSAAHSARFPDVPVLSYADRRWSSGGLYVTTGFRIASVSPPNYFYFRPEEADVSLRSRVQFQKHKLQSLLPSYDPSKTEVANMYDAGWDRVWDCGNMVLVKDIPRRDARTVRTLAI